VNNTSTKSTKSTRPRKPSRNDTLVCRPCALYTTRWVADRRIFNPGRCARCNGELDLCSADDKGEKT